MGKEGASDGEVSPGGNRFINLMVRFPCSCASVIMLICLVTVVGTMMVVQEKGAEIFASGSNNDLNDIRTVEWEAFSQAKEVSATFGPDDEDDGVKECGGWGVKRKCDNMVYPILTQRGHVILTLFVAKDSDNLFTVSSLTEMKAVEDKIVLNKNFSTYCKRGDKSGVETTCAPPLSPLGLFYADMSFYPGGGSMKGIFDEVDALDGSTDGKLDVFSTEGLSTDLAMMNAAVMRETMMMGQYMRSMATPNMTMAKPACFDKMTGMMAVMMGSATTPPDLSSMLNCVMSSGGNSTSTEAMQLYMAMYPMTMAMMRPKGSQLQDVEHTLKLAAYMKTTGFYAPQVDFFFDKDFTVANPKSKYSRGMISFGTPLEGFKNRDDRKEEQNDKFTAWFREEFNDYLQATATGDGEVEVLFFATPLIRDEFLAIIVADCLKVLISLSLVFLWIWAQTKSFFIAVVGIIEIILSIPLAFFFYYTICGFKYFDGLNAMTIFIVAAIGADDIFVFMDQYKQSAYHPEVCKDLQTRMNWVYSRASWAMFITSATTCAAFVCTALSPLPSIQSFGIFSAYVIVADYILVITWFPACVVLYHNVLEDRPCCLCCLGLNAEKEKPCMQRIACRCNQMWPCTGLKCNMLTSTQKVQDRQASNDQEPTQKRYMERCIQGPFAGFLGSKYGAPGTVIFFLLLLIPGIILGTSIEPLSRAEESLPADHPFQRLWTLSGEKFGSSAQNTGTPVFLVWGVDGVNNDKINLLRDGEATKGELMWDSGFKFDEVTQQHIYDVCQSVKNMEDNLPTFLSRDKDSLESFGEVECPVQQWKEFLETNGQTFPLPLADVPVQMALFLESTVKNDYGQKVPVRESLKTSFGYDPQLNGGSVRFIAVEVSSQLQSRASHNGDKLREAYEHFDEWIIKINAKAPSGANNAFQTSDGDFNGPNWIWMHTQGLFTLSAMQGAISGTILAFVVILLATRQIIIAFASFVTIGAILICVLAMMKLADFELGTITSICITILAGFAVDYVVHLAHAYNEARGTREDKFKESFEVIGVSVLSGMVTSVLAATVLLFCSLQFFAKFGFFLIFTVIWAWLWGNCFFMCLMRLIGPDDNTHWILQLPNSILPTVPCCNKKTETLQGS